MRSAQLFEKAKKRGTLAISKTESYKGYDLYEYHEDRDYENREDAAKATIQHKLNVENGGRPFAAESKRISSS